MRIAVVGATGTIGSAVSDALAERGHEVLRVGSSSGPYRVDLERPASIRALYDSLAPLDGVVSAAGIARFGSLHELDDEAWSSSLRNKLMGQVDLVRLGLEAVSEGGSFTLTSGGLSTRPAPGAVAVTTVGAAVEAFARGAALDLADRWRVNVVSPGWVAESRMAQGLEPMPGIWARDLAEFYVGAVEGTDTGQVFEAERPLAGGAAPDRPSVGRSGPGSAGTQEPTGA